MRRALHSLHRWAGVLLGLMIAALGISGSVLVYRADIERWQTRAWRAVEPIGTPRPLDDAVALALARFPDRELAKIVLPSAADETVQVFVQTPRPRTLKEADLHIAYVDPYRGTVVATRAAAQGWLYRLQDFHYALFAEQPGLRVNGAFAGVLLVLAFSGPVLWWPGWRRLGGAFRVRARPPKAFWRDLHALTGVLASVMLLVTAATGLYFAYRSTATAAITLLTGNGAVVPPTAPGAGAPAPVEDWLQAVRRGVPGAAVDELRPPRRAGGAASISFRLPGDHVIGRHRAFVDPGSADLLRVDRFEELPTTARIVGNMGPWHFGSFGGRLSQALWCVAGLASALLFGSGAWLWARRPRSGSGS